MKPALLKGLSVVARWALSIGILLLIWQFVLARHIQRLFFASPGRTWTVLHQELNDGTIWAMVKTTLAESMTGLALGTAIGLLLGLTIGLAPYIVGKLLEPIIVAVYATPKLVLAPIFFVAFGQGFDSIVLLVITAVFPVIAIYTVSGIRTVDPDVARMMQLFGASKQQVGRKLLMPHTMGYFITGLLYVAPHAITVGIAAEIVFGSTTGIGGELGIASSHFNSGGVLAALVVGTVLGVTLLGLTRLVGNKLVGMTTAGAEGGSARRSVGF